MLDVYPDTAIQPDQRDEHTACGSRSDPFKGSGVVAPGPTPAWAVVQSHPQAERWALANLQRQGFEAYLPTHTIRIRDNAIRSLWHPVERPLFTGYLFVQPGTHWAPICHTLGVRRLLMAGHRPGYVANNLMAALRATETARRCCPLPNSEWKAGAAVRLCEGALEGHEAVIVAVHHDRAHVAVMLFGAVRNVNVSVAALTPRNE